MRTKVKSAENPMNSYEEFKDNENDEEIIKLYNKMTYEYLTLERNKYVNSCLNETLINATDPVYEINDFSEFI